jgi:hypothetical protein
MNYKQQEQIKTFLNKCKIVVNNFDELDGMLIPREIFLDEELYKKVEDDINILKTLFTSSALTCLQSTAKETQKWPLLNLVRQVLKSCHYKMTPKRVSAGYTKEGKKIFKRMFIIEKFTQTASVPTSLEEITSDSSLSSST